MKNKTLKKYLSIREGYTDLNEFLPQELKPKKKEEKKNPKKVKFNTKTGMLE